MQGILKQRPSSSWLATLPALFPLPLGEIMRSDSLLEELQAALLLPNPQQLLGSPLIGSEASNLANEIPHKFVVLCQLALFFAGFGHHGVWGGLVTLFQTNADLIPGSHLALLRSVFKLMKL